MAQMTLDQLRVFLTVAEYLHFTRAADALYITQPAVSAAIHNLETEYGIKLFHRLGRRIELTEAGQLLCIEARKILEQVALTERALKELSNLQRGELKLGSSLTIGNYWLPEKISQFQCHYPNININCTLANSEEICLGTEAGKFDLGLIEGGVKADLKEVLYQEKIGSDRLLIVVGKQHPWFNLESVKLSDLYNTDWIMREPGSGTQQRLEEALIQWGIVPEKLKTTLIFNTGEMIKAVLENSQTAAGISELMVKKEIKLGTLKAIKIYHDRGKKYQELEMTRPFLKIKHKERFQTKVAQVFEKLLSLTE
ncbi:LysR substrate-binding domain-containing protein [Geminocystis sp. GBBB08]|uniref:LysR substrate-binding domain-containing protein n=1 Tax=Geminocystis sp. GBBB08 TaxID=2604140 RepID=UPI0027E3A200|nr:LysR substrate-binding domain-containing protein [Geminocystis sp. GBBB08]MBL1208948.1 LysR family transcriptional regulator [Geminocystis sp. GBBB08]